MCLRAAAAPTLLPLAFFCPQSREMKKGGWYSITLCTIVYNYVQLRTVCWRNVFNSPLHVSNLLHPSQCMGVQCSRFTAPMCAFEQLSHQSFALKNLAPSAPMVARSLGPASCACNPRTVRHSAPSHSHGTNASSRPVAARAGTSPSSSVAHSPRTRQACAPWRISHG